MYVYNVTHQNVNKLQITMYQYNVTHQNVYKLQKTMYQYNVEQATVSMEVVPVKYGPWKE